MKQSILSNVMSINSKRLAMNILGLLKVANNPGIMMRDLAIGTLAPACAKSLFMSEMEKGMRFEVYYTEGAAITKAGLQKFIAENPHKEIIIIDEIDKMPIQHQEGLLTMMERGEFTRTKSETHKP